MVCLKLKELNSNNNLIQHRTKENSLIPFLKIRFKPKDIKNIVKLITIGPLNNLDVSESGLKSYRNKNKLEFINLKKSDVPIRY